MHLSQILLTQLFAAVARPVSSIVRKQCSIFAHLSGNGIKFRATWKGFMVTKWTTRNNTTSRHPDFADLTPPLLRLRHLRDSYLNQRARPSTNRNESILRNQTSDRAIYDRARQSAALRPTSNKEVLLYNNDYEVMDGSITTVYFFRDNKWATPHSGSLKGITRRYALENELCSIASPAISKESLKDGETVWLSNAFRGFFTTTFRKR